MCKISTSTTLRTYLKLYKISSTKCFQVVTQNKSQRLEKYATHFQPPFTTKAINKSSTIVGLKNTHLLEILTVGIGARETYWTNEIAEKPRDVQKRIVRLAF